MLSTSVYFKAMLLYKAICMRILDRKSFPSLQLHYIACKHEFFLKIISKE